MGGLQTNRPQSATSTRMSATVVEQSGHGCATSTMALLSRDDPLFAGISAGGERSERPRHRLKRVPLASGCCSATARGVRCAAPHAGLQVHRRRWPRRIRNPPRVAEPATARLAGVSPPTLWATARRRRASWKRRSASCLLSMAGHVSRGGNPFRRRWTAATRFMTLAAPPAPSWRKRAAAPGSPIGRCATN